MKTHSIITHFVLTAALLNTSVAGANPFFPMDTAARDLNELETVKTLGYDGIGWKTGNPREVAAVVQQVRQQGLKLFAVYAPRTVLTKTSLVLDAGLDAVMKELEGTDAVIWLPITSKDFAPSSPEGDAVAVPVLQALADRAAKSGLRVAIYPHMTFWIERVQDAVRLAKQVNRKNFGVTFNLCHCLKAGDEAKIPELLTEAAPHLFLVTINGADAGAAGTRWPRVIQPLDQGSYDVGIVLKKLAELKYTGSIGLQAFGVRIPVKDNLARSMNAWHKLNQDK